jgi:hypothetical protein
MTLSRVGILPIRSEMAGIVEFDRGDDARVRSDDQEIDRKLANPVPHDVIALTALESQGPRQLNLGQHKTFGKCLQQAPVEDLFRLAENAWSRLQWPWTIPPAGLPPAGPCQCSGSKNGSHRHNPKKVSRHRTGLGGSPNPPRRIDAIGGNARELCIKANAHGRTQTQYARPIACRSHGRGHWFDPYERSMIRLVLRPVGCRSVGGRGFPPGTPDGSDQAAVDVPGSRASKCST